MEILIVEDNKVTADSIKKVLLKRFNLTIHHACCSKDAYQIAMSKNIKIFFMDIGLPDIDGITLAKKIRNVNQYKCTPIIFETASGEKEIETHREVEWSLYLIKPFYPNQVIDRFQKAKTLTLSLKEESKMLELKCSKIHHSIQTENILYIEASGGGIFIYSFVDDTIQETYYKGCALYKTLEKLQSNFIRCHKKYIININFLTLLEYDYLLLMDKIVINIGREFRSAVKGVTPIWIK